jgi:diguanylate cyclase (GGDEF)-like protein
MRKDGMKVLIVEDDRITRLILQKQLAEWGYEVYCAEDGEAAQTILQSEEINFIITDWMMPKMNGIELIESIRASQYSDMAYIILLTARDNKTDIVKGIASGADDYITKPFDNNELKVRVRAGKRIVELHQKLMSLIQTDPLTGLYNYRYVSEHLQYEIERCRRESYRMVFIMCDIDKFKKINDNYGHAAGDVVLREVASRLRSTFRPYDTVARIGGEEFLIIISDYSCSEGGMLADRARQSIQKKRIRIDPETAVHVTGSFGVAAGTPSSLKDAEALIHLADTALYCAKENGRNRVEMHSEESADYSS